MTILWLVMVLVWHIVTAVSAQLALSAGLFQHDGVACCVALLCGPRRALLLSLGCQRTGSSTTTEISRSVFFW
jgi:hypothetical protein